MDWHGIKYSITNEPASADFVLKFNPVTTTAYFAAEAGGSPAGWSGFGATQMVFWTETVVSSNLIGVETNLSVSGSLDPDITGTYVKQGIYNTWTKWVKNDNTNWWIYGVAGCWYLGDSSLATVWKGPSIPPFWEADGTYNPQTACTGTATIAYSYSDIYSVSTNQIVWQAGYNTSNQAFQIIRDGVVLENWSAPKEPSYPIFRLPMGETWTDFELKASTNNFTNLVYYYISSGTNTVGYGDSNAWVCFSDDYQTDVRAWRKSPPGSNIYAQLTSTNAVVDTIYVMPSHDCEVPWADWMNPTNKNLLWSWVRFDGVDFEKNFDGTKQRWNLIRPDSWELERTTP